MIQRGIAAPSLLLAALVLWSCEVDPLSNRSLPTVGMAYTSGSPSVADIISPDGSGPLSDAGIESVEPGTGHPSGGETVFVHGWGFEKSVEVYFGDSPSPDVFYVNSKKLRVTTPPHALGSVDIAVRFLSGRVKLLTDGFRYETDLSIAAITPATGPLAGGTPVTVTGTGFTAETDVIIGTRLALQTEVVDDQTIYAITPPGSTGGPTDVYLSNGHAVKRGEDLFTYSVLPRLDGALPAAGPTEGGQVVTLAGKWLAPVTEVYFGDFQAEILKVENNQVAVVAPPANEGLVDVVAVGTWGWDVLPSGYLYVDPATLGDGLVAVVPDHGPEAGGGVATLVGCDLVDDPVTQVSFGEAPATILELFAEECAVLVQVPAGAGPVTVAAQGNGQYSLPGGYLYEPTLTVTGVTPNVGPAEGGTEVRIQGSHFSADVQVLVGPLAAGEVTLVDPGELLVTTPPGSPGLADVTVISTGGSATAKNAFLYTVKEPEIWVITPDYGSQAGGTFVEVIGAGFTQEATVWFGQGMAPSVEPRSYGLIWAYTPPNTVGTYDVAVVNAAGAMTLPQSYTYFDPTSWYGGTWGPSIDGAVNVTVFDAALWEPLQEATVILGADELTPYQGKTDINGQVTLSGPGLAGPVDVHVSKYQHDAASIIHFDAENATVYLIPMVPPSTGPTDPVDPLLPGSVAGRVVGLDKYVVVPPGDCKNKTPEEDDGLCEPCIEDAECGAEGVCLALGKSGKYCTRACNEAAEDGCPDGYMCAPVGTSGPHCIPTLGRKTARCELSRTSIYSVSYSGGDEAVVIDNEGHYEMEARLGEVAIICLGGWEDPDTLEFHPLTMGVRRHVNVAPEEHLPDLNIWLNIPLSRELRLRMDHPPTFTNYGGVYEVVAYLDFGSDGVYELPGSYSGLEPDDVVLTSLPEALTGDIYDASYIIYAGARSNQDDFTPYSMLLVDELTDLDSTSVARREPDGSFAALSAAPADEDVRACWTNANGTFLVGGRGRVFLHKQGTFYQLPSVVEEDLNAVTGFPDQSLFAVGNNGVVVRYDGAQWELLGAATDKPLRGVWGSDPDDLHAVGPHRIVSYYQGEWHEQKVTADLFAVAGNGPDSVYAVGAMGRVFHFDGTAWVEEECPTNQPLRTVAVWPDGQVVVAGLGVALRSAGGQWQDLGLAPEFNARSILVEGEGFHLAGDDDLLAHWSPETGFEYEPVPVDLRVNALYRDEAGTLHLAGTPAMMLTPFVPFPLFDAPKDGGWLQQLGLLWHYDGDADPITLHTINITQKTGRSLWRLILDGSVNSVELPDFAQLIGWNTIPSGEKRLRIYSAHAPDFSINSFDLSSLSTLLWRSWAYDMITFDPEPDS